MGRQQSTIDRLPPDIRDALQELLRDTRVTQLEATHRINEILAEEGAEDRLSKSAVNRYARKMEEVGSKLRQSREVAKMWIGRLGAAPQGEVGKLLNEMVRHLAFDLTMHMAEGEITEVNPKMLKDLGVAIERLERAASENVRRQEEIRKQALNQAADTAQKEMKAKGLTDETADEIRRKILGITK